MEKEALVLFGAIVGAVAAYITAKVTSSNQIKIATISTNKDLAIQDRNITNEILKAEVAHERRRLEELHIILSKVSLENSQTVSYIHSNDGVSLTEFRKRYLENCERLHIASAISDLYYPEMRNVISEVYGLSNVFWGYQEGVLRIKFDKNETAWQANLGKVIKASESIGEKVSLLQTEIAKRGSALSKSLNPNRDSQPNNG